MSKRGKNGVVRKIAPHVLLIILGISFLMPFLFLLSTSVKSDIEAFDLHFHLIPKVWRFDNYSKALKTIPYLAYTKNTLIITLLCVLGELISCPLIAYSISKIKWAGGKIIFAVIMATMLIPSQVTMIPVYLIWNKLHLINTYVPLILPSFLEVHFI